MNNSPTQTPPPRDGRGVVILTVGLVAAVVVFSVVFPHLVPRSTTGAGDRRKTVAGESCGDALRLDYPEASDIYFNIGEYGSNDTGDGLVVVRDGTGLVFGLRRGESGTWRECVVVEAYRLDRAEVDNAMRYNYYQFHFTRDGGAAGTYLPTTALEP